MPSSSGRLIARAQPDTSAFLFPSETARVARSRRGAFTLLEILITLALIALLSGVLITGATHLLSDSPTTPMDVFRKALSESRQYAVIKNVEVRLSFDDKEKAFHAATPEGDRTYPVPAAANDLNIDFVAAQKGGSSVLIGGLLVDTQKLESVTFYPDGTCSPFRIQIRTNSDVGTTAIDPWTCAPVLDATKS